MIRSLLCSMFGNFDDVLVIRFLFTTIEMLLQLLRPICPGTVNPEVDYSLLVSMIRSLLCSMFANFDDEFVIGSLFTTIEMLLQLLRPICPGTVNPEVDYSLLVSMIRSLLCSMFANFDDVLVIRFLFTTIEMLLQLLRPICPGTVNPEVDYSLLVSMIRSLLCSMFANFDD